MDEGQVFGVALLMKGREGEADTAPANVGCTAEILDSVILENGRIGLNTIGRRRFRVLSRELKDEVWEGQCEWLDDGPSREETSALATRLKPLLASYLTALARNLQLDPANCDNLEIPDDPYALSMWIASFVQITLDERQKLLTTTSTAERLDEEWSLISRALMVQRAFHARRNQSEQNPDNDENDSRSNQLLSPN